MIKKILPLLIVCFSVGILAGCSSSDPLVGEAESSIKEGNFEAALTASEKYIQQNPQSPLGYYYKGVALGQKGEQQSPPSEATQYYKQMGEAFTEARQKASSAEEVPSQIERIDAIRTNIWQTEHNMAIELATNDSLMQVTENPLDKAIAHLNNATTVEPDSALSWSVLAQVYNMKENYGQAADAQAKFVDLSNNLEAKEYILLSQFYRLDEQPDKAVKTLEQGREKFPENVQIVEGLADTYSKMGDSEKAISLVEGLVEQNPDNPQYRLSYGSQLYQSALKLESTYDENLDRIFEIQQQIKNAQGAEKQELQSEINSLQEENNKLRQEIESLTDRAIVELNATIENRPDEPVAYNTLGIIYQNRAAVIFDKRNMTTDNQKAADLDKQAKAQLEKAKTNYEKAAEIDPDNTNYWRSLFQIYTALGEDEKAAEAEKKAGMQ